MTSVDPGMRIGELGRRVGLSTHALRAWERRYGLLRPVRTVGGYRLYGPGDERRVRAMIRLRAAGTSAAAAAAAILADERLAPVLKDESKGTKGASAAKGAKDRTGSTISHGSTARPAASGRQARSAVVDECLTAATAFEPAIFAALRDFDEAAADAAIDELLETCSLPEAVDDAVLPFLSELGRRWEDGRASVAQEHFVSAIIRRRFAPLTVPRGASAPLCVLAAPAGEDHDLPLLLFGALLSAAGWRVRQLGADTPVDALVLASEDADLLVLAATREEIFLAEAAGLRLLSKALPVSIAGRGATPSAARRTGAVRLPSRQQEALAVIQGLVRPDGRST